MRATCGTPARERAASHRNTHRLITGSSERNHRNQQAEEHHQGAHTQHHGAHIPVDALHASQVRDLLVRRRGVVEEQQKNQRGHRHIPGREIDAARLRGEGNLRDTRQGESSEQNNRGNAERAHRQQKVVVRAAVLGVFHALLTSAVNRHDGKQHYRDGDDAPRVFTRHDGDKHEKNGYREKNPQAYSLQGR